MSDHSFTYGTKDYHRLNVGITQHMMYPSNSAIFSWNTLEIAHKAVFGWLTDKKCQYKHNDCLSTILIIMLISPCDHKRKTNVVLIYTGKIYHTIRIRNINTVTLRDISQITLNMCLVAGTFYQDITPLSLSQLHTKGAHILLHPFNYFRSTTTQHIQLYFMSAFWYCYNSL